MKLVVNVLMLLFFAAFLFQVNRSAVTARSFPDGRASAPAYAVVDSQRDLYQHYKAAGIWGVRAVHLNQFVNMVDYFPKEEDRSTPFPIPVQDVRPLYEKGLDSHNWLFIANKTGLVRAVTVVLPDSLYRTRSKDFAAEVAYTASGDMITGFTWDIPLIVSTIDSLPLTPEPVVVDIDAGFFMDNADPEEAVRKLRLKCPDIRMILFSRSLDESGVTPAMRERLSQFERAWTGKR